MKKKLFEMAILAKNIVVNKIKNSRFNIQLHGGNDRIYPPHIHIYKDGRKLSEFSIEVNLAHYLETGGEVQFCRIIDVDENINLITPEKCSKYKYQLRFIDMIEDWFNEKPTQQEFKDCRDNLAAALKAFSNEADMTQLRAQDKKEFANYYQASYNNMRPDAKIIFVMMSMHKSIHMKFRKYFDYILQITFKRAFQEK